MICASVAESTCKAMAERARSCACDIVELRLDFLSEPFNPKAFSQLGKPVIATCMPAWEGGGFTGTEGERAILLEKALSFADYITVELKTEPEKRDSLIRQAKKRKVKVIVAYHDFKKTPAPGEIRGILADEESCGADVAKIAFTAKDEDDVLRTLHPLVEENQIPVIPISMGDKGKASRVLGPLLGAYLTYGFPDGGQPAGPGQMSVGELKSIMGGLS